MNLAFLVSLGVLARSFVHVAFREEQRCSDLLSVRLGKLSVSCFAILIDLNASAGSLAAIPEVTDPESSEVFFEHWDSY